ncbi:MAG TPA: hypothetical protein VKX16_10295 [Chloroflexota bacterium]|nr:hypothetical protein [Chloroflexota bacterium]
MHETGTDAYPDITTRLAEMETKLTAAFNAGMATLHQLISTALLEQERRNSTFATRDAVEDCARKVAGLDTVVSSAMRRFGELDRELAALNQRLQDRSLSYVKAATAFLASLLALVLTAIVTYDLSSHAPIIQHVAH